MDDVRDSMAALAKIRSKEIEIDMIIGPIEVSTNSNAIFIFILIQVFLVGTPKRTFVPSDIISENARVVFYFYTGIACAGFIRDAEQVRTTAAEGRGRASGYAALRLGKSIESGERGPGTFSRHSTHLQENTTRQRFNLQDGS